MASRRRHSRARSRAREAPAIERKPRRRRLRRRRRSRRRLATVSLFVVLALAVVLGVTYFARSYFEARGVARYEEALVAFESRNYERTVRMLEQVLFTDPQNLAALVLDAKAYLLLGYPVKAEQALRRAQQAGAERAVVDVLLARSYLQQGRFAGLINELPGRDDDPELRGQLLLMHGLAYLELRQHDAAERAFTESSGLLPNESGPLTGQALVALHDGRDDFAQELVERAAVMSPDDPQVWFVKGEIALARHDSEQSEASYSRAIELDSHFVSARLARAKLRIAADRNESALEDLKAIAAVREDDPQVSWLHALILSLRGERQQAQALIAKASSRLLRFSTEYVMNHSPSLLLMSVARLQSDGFEQAFPLLNRYVELEPQDFGARKLLASVQLIRGLPAQALQVLSPGRVPDGEDAQSLALMSQAHSQFGALDEAARLLWQSLSFASENKPERMQKALIDLALNDARQVDQPEFNQSEFNQPEFNQPELEEALDVDHQFDDLSLMLRVLQHRALVLQGDLRVAQLLAGQHPEHASVANLHGALALSLAQLDESRTALVHALAIAPELSAAQRNLARVDMASGDFDAARARLQGVLAKLPNDPRTVAVLLRLKRLQQDVSMPSMGDSPVQDLW